MATSDTPHYYLNADGTDMYDTFVSMYGYDLVLAHMEMEVRQYTKRALHKGQYESDMHKIDVIQKRMALLIKEKYDKGPSNNTLQLHLPFTNTTP